jgi:hypothetical protein
MSNRRVESFLLRLVVDDQNGVDTEAWRGRIQHIASGHERYFEHMQEIVAFISEQFRSGRVLALCDDEPASEA